MSEAIARAVQRTASGQNMTLSQKVTFHPPGSKLVVGLLLARLGFA